MTKRCTTTALLVLGIILLSVASVFAQGTWQDRVYIQAGGGYQMANGDFAYDDSQVVFQEQATAQYEATGQSDFVWEVGGGVRLINNLGAGVTYTQYETDMSGVLSATIPHPLLFNTPSSNTLKVPTTRREKAVHIEITYVFPIASKLQLRVFGGPSRFDYSQNAVENFMVNFTFEDFFEFGIDLSDPELRELEGSAWGYNVGTDLSFMFSKNAGIGATFRWARASTDVENALEAFRTDSENMNTSIDLGGAQLLGGVRIRF